MVILRLGLAFLIGFAAPAQSFFFGGAAPTTPAPVVLLPYQHYAVGYSEAAQVPLWSVYQVTGLSAQPAPAARAQTFFTEYRTSSQVHSQDYRHTGYSRGHMTPFAAIARAFGEAPALETFSMANVAPQLQSFNAGIWSRLEAAVDGRGSPAHFRAGLTQKTAHIWVYTGPVLEEDSARIGPKGIMVPAAFWKAAIWFTPEGQAHACAWIIPHKPGLAASTFRSFALTMREVERQAHVTLVPGDEQGVMERLDADEVP